MKLGRLLKTKGSILKYMIPPLWPTYIGEKEDTIFQGIWDKSEMVWRTCWGKRCKFGEHIGNPLVVVVANNVTRSESGVDKLPNTKDAR
jgi:hypothetical protein